MILKRTKKYKNVINLLAKPIGILLVLFSLLFLFSMDERQQNNYQNLRDGYIKLNEHNFTDASKIFSDYLASHDSSLYWWLVENINDSMYFREDVYNALQKCNSEIENNK